MCRQNIRKVSDCSKVARYKINIQRELHYNLLENNIIKHDLQKIPFIVGTKGKMYKDTNLTKDAKDMHRENVAIH